MSRSRPSGKRPNRHTHLPWSPAATVDEVRAYVQDRLALLSQLTFWIFWALLGFVFGLYRVYPATRPERTAIVHAFAIAGLCTLGLVWALVLRRRRVALDTLYKIDAAYALLIGVAFGASAYYSSDQRAAVYAAFIWHTFWVFTRVFLIPSSARRTAAVTALSFGPIVAAGVGMAVIVPERLEIPAAAFVIGDVLFAGIAVGLATTGSRIIYGLRRQVSEARQLGQYILGDKIGQGGMGAVYRARHALLRRPTAIKLVPPERVGFDALARFEREVQHMSELTHPNTVAIYDYGRSPDGVFYYAMELLDGVDLETLVKLDGPQPAPRVIRILAQVCAALDEAHGKGLTHRDIKPANVLLCQRGNEPDVAKVLDFGLVQEIDRGSDDGTVLAGTPAYLAPERVTSPDQVGPPADLYAVGAVGYFLLTGQRVFADDTPLAVCLAHVNQPVVPPSQRTDRPIPAGLEAALLACLAKAPAARPTARALRATLLDLPEAADWDEDAARTWWRDAAARRRPPVDPEAPTASVPFSITIDLGARG